MAVQLIVISLSLTTHFISFCLWSALNITDRYDSILCNIQQILTDRVWFQDDHAIPVGNADIIEALPFIFPTLGVTQSHVRASCVCFFFRTMPKRDVVRLTVFFFIGHGGRGHNHCHTTQARWYNWHKL